MTADPGGRPLAIVTGGARRVGRATCLALAKAGCDVVLTYRASAAAARELVEELQSLGARARAEPLDMDNPDAAEQFGAALARREQRIDILVHNASVYEPSPLAELDAAVSLRHYRVNALAPLLLTKSLAARLAESALPGGGAVVTMCDIHALDRPRKDFAAYALSKAALAHMTLCLARELAPRVRVNGVAPGVVAFPESGRESDPEMQRRYLSRVPLARSGTPQEAAEAVRWLALDASYTTGQILRLDGGRSLT